MKNKKTAATNQFQLAVEATAEIEQGYEPGLRALKSYSKKVALGEPHHCTGSVDIDETVRELYPQANRWDYCFCYKTKVYFVEVHSANTSEVSIVLRKLEWLKDWLNQKAPLIKSLKADEPYYWIQSNGFHILRNSSQYRLMIQKSIKPVAKLILP